MERLVLRSPSGSRNPRWILLLHTPDTNVFCCFCGRVCVCVCRSMLRAETSCHSLTAGHTPPWNVIDLSISSFQFVKPLFRSPKGNGRNSFVPSLSVIVCSSYLTFSICSCSVLLFRVTSGFISILDFFFSFSLSLSGGRCNFLLTLEWAFSSRKSLFSDSQSLGPHSHIKLSLEAFLKIQFLIFAVVIFTAQRPNSNLCPLSVPGVAK